MISLGCHIANGDYSKTWTEPAGTRYGVIVGIARVAMWCTGVGLIVEIGICVACLINDSKHSKAQKAAFAVIGAQDVTSKCVSVSEATFEDVTVETDPLKASFYRNQAGQLELWNARYCSYYPFAGNCYYSPQTGHMHASLVETPRQNYVLTEAPTRFNHINFFNMINNLGIKTIVSIVMPQEKRGEKLEEKCFAYWEGTASESSVVYSRESGEGKPAIVKRTLNINGHEVIQYHFQNWPDHGVVSCEDFAALIKMIPHDPNSPILVHCSAGVGRTGTFVGTHSLYLENPTNLEVDTTVARVNYMRGCRPGVVQTSEQFNLMHNTLRHLRGKSPDKDIDAGKFSDLLNYNDAQNQKS